MEQEKAKQPVNPLEVMSGKINQQLVDTTAKTIEDIAENIPDNLTRMYEEDFVRKFLPLFYYDPNNVLNRAWLEISTSMLLEVVLVDRDDNEVYRVPPFMPSLVKTKGMQELRLGHMAGEIQLALENNKGYMAMDGIHEALHEISKNSMIDNHDKLWADFYDRYNEMIKIEDADGNNLLEAKPKPKKDGLQHLDF